MTGLIIFIVVLILGHIGVKYLPNVGIDSQTMADANAEYIPLSKDEEKEQEPEKEKEPEPDYSVYGNNLSEEHKGIIKCSNIKSAQFLAGMLFDMFGCKTNDKVIITSFEVIDNKTINVVYVKIKNK